MQVMELILIELVVISLVSPPPGYNGSKTEFYISIGCMIFIIYMIIQVLSWLKKYKQAIKLTEQLKTFQTAE